MKRIVMILVIISLMGCTSTITTRKVRQAIPTEKKTEQEKLVDTISYVLIENGFEIKNINKTFGLMTTEWRGINDNSDNVANVLGVVAVGLGGGSYTNYSRKMMLQIKTKDNGYQITPKLAKVSKTNTTFKSDENKNITYPGEETNEGKLVLKIIGEINKLLEIEDDYIWTEKNITVN